MQPLLRVCRQTIGGDGMFLVSMEMPGCGAASTTAVVTPHSVADIA